MGLMHMILPVMHAWKERALDFKPHTAVSIASRAAPQQQQRRLIPEG